MVSILAATGRSSAHTLLTLVNQISSITELLRNGESSFCVCHVTSRDGSRPTHSRENVEEEICFGRVQGTGSEPTGSTVASHTDPYHTHSYTCVSSVARVVFYC